MWMMESYLVPHLQEFPWEIFAFIHSLKVGNEFLTGHLFANVLKDTKCGNINAYYQKRARQ